MYKRYEGNGILEWATMIRLVYRFCRGMFFFHVKADLDKSDSCFILQIKRMCKNCSLNVNFSRMLASVSHRMS